MNGVDLKRALRYPGTNPPTHRLRRPQDRVINNTTFDKQQRVLESGRQPVASPHPCHHHHSHRCPQDKVINSKALGTRPASRSVSSSLLYSRAGNVVRRAKDATATPCCARCMRNASFNAPVCVCVCVCVCARARVCVCL